MSLTRINALGYVLIETRDTAQWAHFLTQVVGLQAAGRSADWDLYKMDAYCWRVAVVHGERERFHTAGWELAADEDLEALSKRLAEQGVHVSRLSEAACAQRKIRDGLALNDPSGQRVELVKSCALDCLALQSDVGVPAFETGFNGDMGLGHYVLPTRDFDACIDFYHRLLGFEFTDSMQLGEQGLHFLHVDNPRHHSLAIYQDPNPAASGCVHLMFEVPDLDQLGLFMDRCRSHNVGVAASLGKHCNDQMVSVYVNSPGGFAIEFGCGGLQLDWQHYRPTFSTRPSQWGHHWQHADN